jgi:hypothetical protein
MLCWPGCDDISIYFNNQISMSNPLDYTFFTSEIQQKVHEMTAMLPLEGHLPSSFLRT